MPINTTHAITVANNFKKHRETIPPTEWYLLGEVSNPRQRKIQENEQPLLRKLIPEHVRTKWWEYGEGFVQRVKSSHIEAIRHLTQNPGWIEYVFLKTGSAKWIRSDMPTLRWSRTSPHEKCTVQPSGDSETRSSRTKLHWLHDCNHPLLLKTRVYFVYGTKWNEKSGYKHRYMNMYIELEQQISWEKWTHRSWSEVLNTVGTIKN
jgi:hypothetical protein